MNPQLRKEFLGLRWVGVVAGLMVVLPALPLPGLGRYPGQPVLWAWLLLLGCVLLGMEVLGQEFSSRTFSQLLTQPVSRRELWRRKMAVLAAGLGLVVAAFLFATLRAFEPETGLVWNPPTVGAWILVCGVIVLAGVGLALWLSVELRQPAAVFWLAVLFPVSVYGLVGMLLEKVGASRVAVPAALATLAGVGAWAWWAAWRGFLRAEDVVPLGQELRLPRMRGWAVGRGRGSPRAALWWKEVRLHQLPAVITLLAAVLLAAFLVIHWLAPSDVHGIVLVVFLLLWLLIPVFVGAEAVAEERRLGTISGWRMLPVSQAGQWWTKVGAVLAVSALLGGLVPYALNGAMWWMLHPTMRDTPLVPLWGWGLSCVVGGVLGLYASSLSRTLVQALSVAVCVAGGWALVLGFVVASQYGDLNCLRLNLAVSSVLMPTLLWLAAGNAALIQVDRRAVRRNAAVVSGVLLFIGLVTGGVYGRVWERVMPEPIPGPVIPKVAGVQPMVNLGAGRTVVLTPDGRLWGYRHPQVTGGQGPEGLSHLGAGRTYVRADASWTAIYALDGEGSLWEWPVKSLESGQDAPRQIGSDGEWAAVSTGGGHTVALKKDGSIWGWGRSREGQLGVFSEDSVERARLGADRVWRLASAGYASTLAVDREGRVWRWGRLETVGPSNIDQVDWSAPHLLAEAKDWVELTGRAGMGYGFGVTADGTSWVFRMGRSPSGKYEAAPPQPLNLPIRRVDVVYRPYRGQTVLALLADGALMRWRMDDDLPGDLVAWLNQQPRSPLGARNDWLALCSGGFALTADGVVWGWPYGSTDSWLGPTQRPQPLVALGGALAPVSGSQGAGRATD